MSLSIIQHVNGRRFNVDERSISYKGNTHKLTWKGCQVLQYLLENYLQPVSREELIKAFWEDNYLIGDKGLTHIIWQLRKVLENNNQGRVIETIPKFGYRILLNPVCDFYHDNVKGAKQLIFDKKQSQLYVDGRAFYVSQALQSLLQLFCDQQDKKISIQQIIDSTNQPRKSALKVIFEMHANLLNQGLEIGVFDRLENGQLSLFVPVIDHSESGEAISNKSLTAPYKGLKPFTSSDQELFFGREELTKQGLNNLQKNRFLAVVGEPASGKSSLLQAGLLPQLLRQHYCCLSLSPDKNPQYQLNEAFRKLFAEINIQVSSDQIAQSLEKSDGIFDLATRYLGQTQNGKLCIIIDRFEEIFTLCKSKHHQSLFIDSILNVLTYGDKRIQIIIALRAYFIETLATYPQLYGLINCNTVELRPMATKELSSAIELPAQKCGLKLEKELVQQLLVDTAQIKHPLPLVESTLLELFEAASSNSITLKEYEEIDGLVGTIKRRAENIFQAMSVEQQDIFKNIFAYCLTDIEESGEYVRRKVSIVELSSFSNCPDSVAAVLKILVNASLLASYSYNGRSIIEVNHMCLISNWPVMKTWLAQCKQDNKIVSLLRSLSSKWNSDNRKSIYLLNGEILRDVTKLQERLGEFLNETVNAYILESARH